MQGEGGLGSRMQEEASQLMWPETEMECMKSGVSSLGRNSTTYSHQITKPLLNGCLNGELHALVNYGLRSICLNRAQSDPQFKKMMPYSLLKIPNITLLRRDSVLGATHRAAVLGLFEILTKKFRNANDGMPLTLYQEAWCGLTSGATAAFVWQPFLLAQNRVGLLNLTYSTWFNTLSHIVKNEGALTLWRGSGWYVGPQAVTQMGLLVSYYRSQNYLIESRGLPESKAQICASIISGFFASVGSHSCDNVKQITDFVQKKYHGGEKDAYSNIPHYISRVLTPYSGSEFYVRFIKCFHANALFCMVHWWIYEQVRKGVDYEA